MEGTTRWRPCHPCARQREFVTECRIAFVIVDPKLRQGGDSCGLPADRELSRSYPSAVGRESLVNVCPHLPSASIAVLVNPINVDRICASQILSRIYHRGILRRTKIQTH